MTCPLSFLLVLRGSLYETTVIFNGHVLMARRAIHVPTMVTFNVGQAYILLITVTASVSLRAHGELGVCDGFARVGLAGVGLEASVSKKVPMTRLATLSGFKVSGVSILEIGAIFLSTGSAQLGLGASMHPLGVVGFPTIRTDITGPEKPRQLGDDIIMVFVVQQDQLFISKGSKRRDVKGTLSIHQNDLVTDEGWGLTKSRQSIVAAWAEGYVGFPMQVPSEGSLQWSVPLANAFEFWVLVHASFGDHEGSGTTEFVIVCNCYDRPFVGSQQVHRGMTWFPTTGFAGALRSMMDLSDGDLKGIVHFKLFVAVQGLG